MESALELNKQLSKELKSGLIAGGNIIHALLAITNCKKIILTKFHNNRIAAVAICDPSDDSGSNKRPYAHDAMSAAL